MTAPENRSPQPDGRGADLPTFRALLATMFQGALSDNMYRFIIIMLVVILAQTHAVRQLGEENAGTEEAQELATQLASNYQAIASGLFILPFALAVGLAGWMSDRYSKTTVTRFTKLMEIGIMSLATLVFLAGPPLIGENYIWAAVGILFLMGLQSALFSPSKYAILAELLPRNRIGWGNGYLQGFTFFAIVLGTVAGPALFGWFEGALWAAGLILVVLATVGYGASRRMALTPVANPEARFRPNPIPMVWKYGKIILASRGLRWAVLGSTIWWLVAVMLQLAIVQIALNVLDLSPEIAGIAILPIVVFQGLGSLLVSRLCREGIRLWLVPLGAVAMCLLAVGVTLATPLPGELVSMREELGRVPLQYVVGLPLLIGVAAFFMALYIVPLDAYIIQTSDERHRGGIWATSNVLSSSAMVLGSFLLPVFAGFRGHAADAFAGGGVIMLLAAVVLAWRFLSFMRKESPS